MCRLSVPPVHWLCPHCWKNLRSFYLSPPDMVRQEKELTHFRLFNWSEENDFFIRLFLNSLKKGGPSFIFNQVVLDFLYHVTQVYSIPRDTVIIPAPSYSRSPDHALCLASAFSRFSGLELYNVLFPYSPEGKNRKQKQRIKTERRKIYFSVKEKCILEDKKIIFVDDILTTGSTARAAWEALCKPRNFVIFTLAWRSDFLYLRLK